MKIECPTYDGYDRQTRYLEKDKLVTMEDLYHCKYTYHKKPFKCKKVQGYTLQNSSGKDQADVGWNHNSLICFYAKNNNIYSY